MSNSSDRLDRIEALMERLGQNLEATQQLADTSLRAIQTDNEQSQQSQQAFRDAIVRITQLNESLAQMVSPIDEPERLTILRRLDVIERKVDQLLEQTLNRGNNN